MFPGSASFLEGEQNYNHKELLGVYTQSLHLGTAKPGKPPSGPGMCFYLKNMGRRSSLSRVRQDLKVICSSRFQNCRGSFVFYPEIFHGYPKPYFESQNSLFIHSLPHSFMYFLNAYYVAKAVLALSLVSRSDS